VNRLPSLSPRSFPDAIPSPAQAVWHLGPLPIRAYALWILLGIVLAIRLTTRRWLAAGGRPGTVLDVAAYAIPCGIVGARLYHVATSWQPYFGADGHPWNAFKVWEGGLGIWGAVAGGALGAYIACARLGVSFVKFADAVAPALPLAQAIGRLGNWFNNEIYGGRTDLPWGLQVHEWDAAVGAAVKGTDGQPLLLPGLYHPTFLYELIWCLIISFGLVLLDKRFTLDGGKCIALYIMLYTFGRFFIEGLRVDSANLFWGHRLNEWTSVLVFLGGAVGFAVATRRSRTDVQHADSVSKNQDS
jgi:prolipoprotein diacylglyceryl transferase